jgi:hypothetical protein
MHRKAQRRGREGGRAKLPGEGRMTPQRSVLKDCQEEEIVRAKTSLPQACLLSPTG